MPSPYCNCQGTCRFCKAFSIRRDLKIARADKQNQLAQLDILDSVQGKGPYKGKVASSFAFKSSSPSERIDDEFLVANQEVSIESLNSEIKAIGKVLANKEILTPLPEELKVQLKAVYVTDAMLKIPAKVSPCEKAFFARMQKRLELQENKHQLALMDIKLEFIHPERGYVTTEPETAVEQQQRAAIEAQITKLEEGLGEGELPKRPQPPPEQTPKKAQSKQKKTFLSSFSKVIPSSLVSTDDEENEESNFS